jgi:hypothetical protein
MMTQGLDSQSTALAAAASVLPVAGTPLVPERGRPKGIDVTMSSPGPSHDPFAFDSYEQWDPYDDSSQQQAQANKSYRLR